MAISNVTIKALQPKSTAYKVSDEKGLFVLVHPNGSKYWRLKYRYAGKEKVLALGVYPEVTLKQARDKREDARVLLAGGIDPGEDRKAARHQKIESLGNTLRVVMEEWFDRNMGDRSPAHQKRVKAVFRNDLIPFLGDRPVNEIKAVELLAVLRRIEERGAVDTTHRALQLCGQVFRYAVATGRAERDITPDLKGALKQAGHYHFSSMTDPKIVAGLLRAIDDYTGTYVVKTALQLAPLVFVRPGELRQAEWAAIDLEAKEWRYLVTKTKTQHIVPLSRQAVELLTELRRLTGDGRYVFPSALTPGGSRCMSDVALLAALRRMGFDKSEMSAHGFRAMARTILDEVLGVRPDFIEHQLAHAVRDPNGRAYNRTAHLPERHKMMQQWADYLDMLKSGGQVLEFKRVGGG
jgi:integrase